MILLYVPCKDKKEAKKIAKELLKKKIVVCANIFPIDSLYFWEGKLNEDKETVLLVKTLNTQEEEVKEEIKKLHSYDIPCILTINARANEEYLAWAETQL